jgi:hypothetical protein
MLDFIGRSVTQLCRQLYAEDITEPLVMAFLRRRFVICCITTTATATQIFLQMADAQRFSVAITACLLPLTIVDRQFCTLVTKMTPRYEVRVHGAINSAIY